MAKQCEVCGKTPVVGRIAQPRQQRPRAPVRAESAARPGDGQRRHPPHPRLHPLHPVQQGHQGRLSAPCGPDASRFRHRTPRPRSGRTARPSGPATSCSSPVRFRSIRRPARSSSGGIAEQTHRVLKNLGAILAAAGASFDHVVKTTVYLADMSEFAAMNEIYGDVLPGARARARHDPGRAAAARRPGGNRSASRDLRQTRCVDARRYDEHPSVCARMLSPDCATRSPTRRLPRSLAPRPARRRRS